jgi:hypothetical protein
MRISPRSIVLGSLTAATGVLAVAMTPRPAPAWPTFLATWQAHYPNSTTDDNVIAGYGQGCMVCHFNPGGGDGWNPYGWEIRTKFYAGYAIDDAINAAEKWDSDANPFSWRNIIEINANTQPGWTPGAVNIEHFADGSVLTAQMPPALIAGDLDPTTPSPMISFCDPGVGTVMTCPCGNPQSGLNRGCDNSFSTTGAALTAEGTASLSADTLVFTTGGEKPTALSVLMQGKAFSSTGFVYGQGVRCVNTTLKRLFNKSAVDGSVTIPNFGGGDPSVSAKSAAKGDTINAGEDRYYLVYYRDPTVLGGCPATSGFNTTQSGQVTWAP